MPTRIQQTYVRTDPFDQGKDSFEAHSTFYAVQQNRIDTLSNTNTHYSGYPIIKFFFSLKSLTDLLQISVVPVPEVSTLTGLVFHLVLDKNGSANVGNWIIKALVFQADNKARPIAQPGTSTEFIIHVALMGNNNPIVSNVEKDGTHSGWESNKQEVYSKLKDASAPLKLTANKIALYKLLFFEDGNTGTVPNGVSGNLSFDFLIRPEFLGNVLTLGGMIGTTVYKEGEPCPPKCYPV